MSDKTELTRVLADLEAILSNAEHNGVNLIFGMGGQRPCHICDKYQATVRQALKVLRAHPCAETGRDTEDDPGGDAGTA